MGPTHRLAIDLGTCHTVAVVRRGDEAPRALLFDGSPVMASGIYADEKGLLSVGRDAERLSQLAPSRFEPFPKRSVDAGSVLLGDSEVTVVEMLAALLKRVADESLQAGVNPVGSTVLTCPADWGGQRRGVLLEAARAANLGPVVLVDEPIAAATYCLRVLGQQVAPLQSLAVFDFGGGTLDVSVVRREPPGAGNAGGLRVLGVGGLDNLGGIDIDAALVGHLGQLIELRDPAIWQRLAHPDSIAAHRDRRALWNEVRSAKEMLSRASSAPIHVPGTEEALHITREELERVAGPLIDRAVDETRRVLERAGVDVRQLAGIFLVGGSSRIPLVASRLHTRFGVAPVVPEQPELPVAYGGMLAIATPPQQLFDGPPVPQSRPVSGTPVSPGHSSAFPPSTAFPVSAGFPVSGTPSAPTSPGAYGSPVGMSQTFNTQSPTAPASPPGTFIPGQGQGPGRGGPAAFGATAPPGVRPGTQGPAFAPPGLARPGVPAGIGGQGAPGGFGVGGFPPGGQPGFTPPPPVVRQRRRTGPWIALVIVLALIGGCLWGGSQIFSWIGNQVQAAKDSFPDTTTTGADGKPKNAKVDGLTPGEPLKIGGDGKFTALAGNGVIFTAVGNAGKVDVEAYEPAGKTRWTVNVPMDPTDIALRQVGNLLIVDGDSDTQRNNDDSRAVIDLSDHSVKWVDTWKNKIDLFYVGTDAVTEIRDGDTAVQRTDLLTGKARWTHKGKGGFITTGDRLVKPVLTWPGAKPSGAVVPSYTLTFQELIPYRESIDTDPGVVVQMQSEGKAATIDTASGAVKASGTVASAGDLPWMVYGGVAMFKKKDSDTSIVAYRLDNFSQAWEFKTSTGTKVEDFRPCGDKLVCVKTDKHSVVAVGTEDGKTRWTKPMKSEPNWYVLDGKLVMGTGGFTAMQEPVVLDQGNGNDTTKLGGELLSQSSDAGVGGRIVMQTIRNSGSTSIQVVALVNISDGKVAAAADYATDASAYDASYSGDTIVLIDQDNRTVYRFAVPAR